jgi:hypothetical protein
VRQAAELCQRRGRRTETDSEQGAGGAEADPQGLGGGGELGLAVGVEDDGSSELLLPFGGAALGLGEALLEVVELAAVGGALDDGGGGVGLAVKGLAANAALRGQGGDVAVVTEEDGVGAGQGGGGS